MEIFYYKSPIGVLEITCLDNTITSLKLTNKTNFSNKTTVFMKTVKKQLDEYFLKKRKIFDIKISAKGTEFQKKVWAELLKIPYGTTKSYSEIAKNIGKKNSQRAVGSACNKNPIMIIIPCHRVISKTGNLNGFAHGINTKKYLLQMENAIR